MRLEMFGGRMIHFTHVCEGEAVCLKCGEKTKPERSPHRQHSGGDEQPAEKAVW